ncbi:MAG TPA: hotdog fold thioesterase [Desulfobacteria bacterium]|nr:hotdog fold thioesterase [Desulfobacteria bacterium]
MDTAENLVEMIKENDRFARLVGIKIEETGKGYARVSLKVEDKHLNAVNITHGGAVFSLADLAFALASNSHNKVALALNMSINFVKATVEGSLLTATAKEDNLTNRTGLYRIEVEDESGDKVALAEGLVYRKG